MQKPKDFSFLVDAIKSLPYIGSKTANKLAYFFLLRDEKYKNDFISRFVDAINNLKLCELCNNITDKTICDCCQDINREQTLCIVFNYDDYERIINTKFFNGYFHILGIDEKLKKIKISELDVEKINKQINELNIKEVILAVPFSINGEIISQHLLTSINKESLNIYRLGFGLPLNANIDYIDDETIWESLLNKKKIN